MAEDRWNSVSVNFSGANAAMSNALRGIAATEASVDSIQKDIRDKAARKEEQRRYDIQFNRQVEADKITMYNAESKGYGQADKVKAAMEGLTGRDNGTDALDNTRLMGAINDRYATDIEDKKLGEYVAKIDAGTALTDTEKADYEKRSNAYNTKLDTLNEKIQNNVTSSDLYKTDATTANGAILKQLMDSGVNPQYAATMAGTLAKDYTKSKAALTEYQKTAIKNLEGQVDMLAKDTVVSTNSTTKSDKNNTSNKSGLGSGTGTSTSSNVSTKALGATMKQVLLTRDSLFTNDGQTAVYKLSQDLRNDKLYQGVDVNSYIQDALLIGDNVTSEWLSSEAKLGDPVVGGGLDKFTKAIKATIAKAAEDKTIRLINKSKSGGNSSTVSSGTNSSTTSSTKTKGIAPGNARLIGKKQGQINAILESLRPRTGKEQLDALIGRSGAEVKAERVTKEAAQRRKEEEMKRREQEIKRKRKVLNDKLRQERKDQLAIDITRNEREAKETKAWVDKVNMKRKQNPLGLTKADLRAIKFEASRNKDADLALFENRQARKESKVATPAQSMLDSILVRQRQRQAQMNNRDKVKVPTKVSFPIFEGATANGKQGLPQNFLRLNPR